MTYVDALKVVFPLLDGKDLASCMQVCKKWRDIARDDYFWKCSCAKRWPSICKSPTPLVSYHKLFQIFYKRCHCKNFLPPRISFDDLEFYIDIWAEERVIFSEVVPGSVFKGGIKDHLPGIWEILRFHLKGPEYQMIIPVDPKFSVPRSQAVSVSVFVGRKDTNKVACIIYKSLFCYVGRRPHKALALDYLDFSSPVYLLMSGFRALVSLLFKEGGGDGVDGLIDVFGIELDFFDSANSEDEVLLLLDMLDWN